MARNGCFAFANVGAADHLRSRRQYSQPDRYGRGVGLEMKVLWFTNTPLPAMSAHLRQRPTVLGGWLPSLASLLRAEGGIELAIATAVPGAPDTQFTSEGIRYYTIAQPPGFHFLRHSKANLDRARAIVAHYRPDVVHVHGTERFYGLIAQQEPDVPI